MANSPCHSLSHPLKDMYWPGQGGRAGGGARPLRGPCGERCMGPIGKTEDRWVGGSAGGRGVLTLVGGSAVWKECRGNREK